MDEANANKKKTEIRTFLEAKTRHYFVIYFLIKTKKKERRETKNNDLKQTETGNGMKFK